jgi:hypothetical protein
MRRYPLALVLLCAIPALAQTTTTYVGTIKDLTGATVTSGRITWALNAPSGGNIPGTGSFVSNTVSCLINASGTPVSSVDGTSPCTVINNTALTPTGTSYTMCRQPYNVTPGSCTITYALGGTVDVSTIVPTPATQPYYGVASLTAANTWGALQTFSGGLVATTGTFSGPLVSPQIDKVIYAQAGETVAAAIARLITANGSAGGTIVLGPGIWQSGSISVTQPNIHIQGTGMPRFNNAYTALSGGTIIQGSIFAIQGADNFWLRDLGVDNGSTFVSGGGTASDAIAIFNSGQVVGAAQLQNVLVQNVSCLGSSATAAFHCLLVENVNHAYINNVLAVGNTHGVVLKGTNSTVDGVWASWHSTDSVNIKSDNYALGNNDVVTNIKIASLFAPGDTGPLFLNSASSETNNPMFNIAVSHVQTESVGTSAIPSAIELSGNLAAYPLTDVNLSDITIDWPGGSTSGYACITMAQSIARVSMSGINCRNYYYAITNAFPDTTMMNDFVLNGSQIRNIAAPSAITTNGRWTITDTSFNAITGNAIVAATGNAQLGNNTCNTCGAYFNKTGGTFTFDFRGYQGNVAQPTLSPAILSNTQAMTAGQLIVNFWNQFDATPDCTATVISANSPGSAAPTVWVNAVSNSGVTFNASSNTFTGSIAWQCFGSFQ